MRSPIKPGDFYEDCDYHIVLCSVASPVRFSSASRFRRLFWIPDDWDYAGMSLTDGSSPRSCSLIHCAPRKVPVSEVLQFLHDKFNEK